MSSLTMNVEVMAGTSFEESVVDARTLAERLNLAFVCYKFNGVSVSVSQHADECEMAEEYASVGGGKHKYIVG